MKSTIQQLDELMVKYKMLYELIEFVEGQARDGDSAAIRRLGLLYGSQEHLERKIKRIKDRLAKEEHKEEKSS